MFNSYFGGSLDLFSLDGWGEWCSDEPYPLTNTFLSTSIIGTDALLKLRSLDEAEDMKI